MMKGMLALAGPALVAGFIVGGGGLPAGAVVSASNGRIAFASDRAGNFDIYSVLPDGTGLTKLTDTAADDDDPAWSRDGSRVAFVRTGACITACKAIWVMEADGTGGTAVTPWSNAIQDTAPAWLSATMLLYTSNRLVGGGLKPKEIWSVPVAGGLDLGVCVVHRRARV